MLEELGGHDGADRVAAAILIGRPTRTVPEPSGHGIGTTALKYTTEYVSIRHRVNTRRSRVLLMALTTTNGPSLRLIPPAGTFSAWPRPSRQQEP